MKWTKITSHGDETYLPDPKYEKSMSGANYSMSYDFLRKWIRTAAAGHEEKMYEMIESRSDCTVVKMVNSPAGYF